MTTNLVLLCVIRTDLLRGKIDFDEVLAMVDLWVSLKVG